jgi:uncharacterized protein YecT (DUF1311 family)
MRSPQMIDKKVADLYDGAKSRQDEQAAYDKGAELWEKELNRVYGKLIKSISPDAVQKLKVAQRAWLSFRAEQIAYFDSFYRGLSGTMYLTAHAHAVMEVTRERVLALDRQLEYVESGDYEK